MPLGSTERKGISILVRETGRREKGRGDKERVPTEGAKERERGGKWMMRRREKIPA